MGPEHPETVMTQWALAVLYKMQRQYTHTEPLYRQALAILEKVKPHHPDTRHLREAYHDLLRKMKQEGERSGQSHLNFKPLIVDICTAEL